MIRRWTVPCLLLALLLSPATAMAQNAESEGKASVTTSNEAPSNTEAANKAYDDAKSAAVNASDDAADAAKKASDDAKSASDDATDAAKKASDDAKSATDAAKEASDDATDAAQKASEDAADTADAANKAGDDATDAAKTAGDAAADAAENASEDVADTAKKARDNAASTAAAPLVSTANGSSKTAAASSATAASAGGVKSEKKSDEANTAVLGAAAPTPPSNPYQLFLTLGFQVGTGTFIPAANRDLVGYTLNFSGLYKLSKLGDGRLDVFGVLNADQSLTVNSAGDLGSVGQREFFFRDIRLGLLGRGLINSKSTGLIFGANTSVDLPTSLQAQAQNRFLRWNISGNLARIFSGVGPGSLLLRLVTTVRFDFGDAALENTSNAALCNSVSVNDAGNCLSGRTGTTFGIIPGVSATYLVGDFNFAVGISFINTWLASASDSSIPDLQATDDPNVTRSPNAPNNTNYVLVTSANVSMTYTATRNLLFTLGLSTAQAPVDKCNQDRNDVSNDTGQCVRFPFFDFNNQTDNLSTVFLNTTLMY